MTDDDTNPSYDVLVHDRTTGVTRVVNRNLDGTQQSSSDRVEVSDDGRYALFRGGASLVPGLPTGRSYVYVRDLATWDIQVANRNSEGEVSEESGDTGSATGFGRRLPLHFRARRQARWRKALI